MQNYFEPWQEIGDEKAGATRFVDKIRKTPDVPQTHAVPNTRQLK